MKRLLNYFFDEVSEGYETRRYQALAYRCIRRRKSVMVLWPFHYAVRLVAWLGWKWEDYRHQDSWVDRSNRLAYERGREDALRSVGHGRNR